MAHVYNLHSLQFQQEERAQGIKTAVLRGGTSVYALDEIKEIPAKQLIKNAEESIELVKQRIHQVEKRGAVEIPPSKTHIRGRFGSDCMRAGRGPPAQLGAGSRRACCLLQVLDRSRQHVRAGGVGAALISIGPESP